MNKIINIDIYITVSDHNLGLQVGLEHYQNFFPVQKNKLEA